MVSLDLKPCVRDQRMDDQRILRTLCAAEDYAVVIDGVGLCKSHLASRVLESIDEFEWKNFCKLEEVFIGIVYVYLNGHFV